MSDQPINQTMSRQIKLEGSLNVRDIGGYATADGRTTRWGRFFRSDSLHSLTADDQAKLLALHLTTIIDLRRQDEVERDPNLLATNPAIHYYNLPILNSAISAPTDHPLREVTSLEQVYTGMLDHFQAPLKIVFDQIADGADAPVLVHCTAGKDRTGIVIGLLLDLVNVPRQTIIEDYAMTAELIAPLLDALRQKAILTGLDVDRHERMLECHPENMAAFLAHLHDTYGGAEAYLKLIGLDDSKINALKDALLS